MAYTSNPQLPRVRLQAVELVKQGWSVRQAARHLGFAHNTVLNWLKRQPEYGWHGRLEIPTLSSRPHHHPKALAPELVTRILALRQERSQCAELLHYRLVKGGVRISLSSVKRVLRRYHLTRFSKWKKWHQYLERPLPEKPGILVEIDTIWTIREEERLYLYTLLDVCSRWAYAWAVERINTWRSWQFVQQVQGVAPFTLATLQSDHGPEFSKHFTKQLLTKGMEHRHSRVRRPTDNGHLERFNRTLQEECLAKVPRSLRAWRKALPEYLHYYNTERPHMGLEFKTPMEVVRSY